MNVKSIIRLFLAEPNFEIRTGSLLDHTRSYDYQIVSKQNVSICGTLSYERIGDIPFVCTQINECLL